MNSNIIVIIFLVFGFWSCSTNEPIAHTDEGVLSLTAEDIEVESQRIVLLFNHEVAKEYFTFLDEKRMMLAIGNFGWPEVRKCWKEVPEIGNYRSDFERADEDFLNFICSKDERMQIALEKWKTRTLENGEWARTKSVVYRDVSRKYPDEYKMYLGERQEKLRLCNYKTLEYLVEDYHVKNKLFPIRWIPSSHKKRIITEEFVEEFNAKTGGRVGIGFMEMN